MTERLVTLQIKAHQLRVGDEIVDNMHEPTKVTVVNRNWRIEVPVEFYDNGDPLLLKCYTYDAPITVRRLIPVKA